MRSLNASLVRVKRRSPCPICGKPDWCSVSEDGTMAICMRIAAGSIKQSKDGGYVHILRERGRQAIHPIYRKPDPPPIASIARRHIVYESMLGASPLNERHGDDLQRRGLSELAIMRNLYASLPGRLRTAYEVAEMMSIFDDLRHVPGFFTDKAGHWLFASGDRGFLIPVRDNEGRIQACQIRRDFGDPRYKWFSSAGRSNGASSGAPIHFARPQRVEATGEAIVIESPLKADIVAERLDCCVIGVPGVSSFAVHFGSWLTSKLPKLRKVLIAYDTDWREKPPVRAALVRLLDSLAEAGLESVVLDWDGAKGLDDLLVKEATR